MKTTKNIPELRFPGFEGEWVEEQFGKKIQRVSEKYNPESDPQEFPCIELESISQNSGTLLQTFNSLELKSIKNKFQKGDILFGKLRPYLKKYYRARFDGVCSSEIWVLKGKNTINEFIYYLIQTEKFNNEVNLTIGSKMPRAEWSYISEIEFHFPSLPEQQKIASFLSAADQRIQLLTQKKEKLEQYKKGIMQQIFSQQLRFKDENGQEYPEWEEKRLGALSEMFSGGTPQSTNNRYYFGKIPFIKSGEINSDKTEQYLTDIGLKMSSAKIVTKGDLLIAIYGATSGEVAISKITGAINQAVICIRGNFNNVFLYNWLKHFRNNIISKYLQGGQGNLSGEILRNIRIKLPSLPEQQKIASFLSSIDQKITLVNQQIELTRKWKQGLLQKMFL